MPPGRGYMYIMSWTSGAALAAVILTLGAMAGGAASVAPGQSSATDTESTPVLIGAGDINDCGHPRAPRQRLDPGGSFW